MDGEGIFVPPFLMPDLPRGGVTVPKTDFGGFDSCIGHKNVTFLWHFFSLARFLYYMNG